MAQIGCEVATITSDTSNDRPVQMVYDHELQILTFGRTPKEFKWRILDQKWQMRV